MMNTLGHERISHLNIMYVRPLMDTYGVSKSIIHLAKAMKSLGHNVVVVSERNETCEKKMCDAGIKSVSAPMDPTRKNIKNYLKSMLILANTIKSEKINIIHSHHRWSTFICILLAKWYRTPLITTYHGIHKGNELLTVWGDSVISVSVEAKQHLVEHFRLKDNKIQVIPNGIPDLEMNGSALPMPTFNDYHVATGTSRIVNIARLSPEKDHETLFIAMRSVIAKYPACQLIVVGDGPLKNKLVTMVEVLGLDNNVVFLGEVTDVLPILKSADFTVLSSITEGLPLAVLESLACGKPVIATSVGAIPAVVENGKTGILVPAKDPIKIAEAICYLIENKETVIEMGRKGREHIARNYGMASVARTTEKVYYDLLENIGLKSKMIACR